MTAPFLEPTLGVDSDLAREEFAEFQRKKAELLAGILQRTGIGQGFGRALGEPAPGTVAVGPMSLYVPPEVQALMQSPSASTMEQRTQDVEDLLAAARYWKIEGAEDMPVEVLRALIEERRNTIARPEEWTHLPGVAPVPRR